VNQNDTVDSEYGVFWGDNLFPKITHKEPVIEHFLYQNDTMLIHGIQGQGKSIWVEQLKFALTSGDPLLDTYNIIHPCNVCHIQLEGDREETSERIKRMEKGLRADHTRWAWVFLEGLELNTQTGRNHLLYLMQIPKMNYDIIILDPLYMSAKGRMTEDDVVSDWIRNIRFIKGQFGKCAVICIGHPNKEFFHAGKVVERDIGSVYGARAWGAFFNTVYKFNQKGEKRILTRGKDRGAKCVKEIELYLVDDDALLYRTQDNNMTSNRAIVEVYLRQSGSTTRKRMIRELEDKMSEPTIDRTLKFFKDSGMLERTQEEGQVIYKWV